MSRSACILVFFLFSVHGLRHKYPRDNDQLAVGAMGYLEKVEMATTFDDFDVLVDGASALRTSLANTPELELSQYLDTPLLNFYGSLESNNPDDAYMSSIYNTNRIVQPGEIFQRPTKPPQVNPLDLLEKNKQDTPVGTAAANPRTMERIQNELRASAGLAPLAYHPDLERFIANYIRTGPSCNSALQHSSSSTRSNIGPFKRLGENLWKGYRQTSPTSNDIVYDWYNEKYCFRYGALGSACTLDCGPACKKYSVNAGCQTGHFTQMMWESLSHIGCSVYKCPSGAFIGGCSYGLSGGGSGNLYGMLPFGKTVASSLGYSTSPCAAPRY